MLRAASMLAVLLATSAHAGEWMTLVRDSKDVRSAMMVWQDQSSKDSIAVSCAKAVNSLLPATMGLSVATPPTRDYSAMPGDPVTIRISLGGATVDLDGEVSSNDTSGRLYIADGDDIRAALSGIEAPLVNVTSAGGVSVVIKPDANQLAVSTDELLTACGL